MAAHNYESNNHRVLLITSSLDADRYGWGVIRASVGLVADADVVYEPNTDIYESIAGWVVTREATPIVCVLVDEAQFLSKAQVRQLCRVVDEMGVAVMAYGLRTDWRGEPFEGSTYLMAWADSIREVRCMSSVNRKATMNVKVGGQGVRIIGDGPSIESGHHYRAVTRASFYEGLPIPLLKETGRVRLTDNESRVKETGG